MRRRTCCGSRRKRSPHRRCSAGPRPARRFRPSRKSQRRMRCCDAHGFTLCGVSAGVQRTHHEAPADCERCAGPPRASLPWSTGRATDAMPFAVRSGGHCYEGFGESESVVIDTRMLDRITFDAQRRVVTAGAGSSLGGIYTALKSSGLAFAAGSCPTVGVSGHMLGGGFGFLARPYGLSCDFLRSIQLVDATGTVVTADANQNPDLFWASRGGGGGTFGVATQFQIGLVPLSDVVVFAVTWRLPVARAVRVFGAWQAWAPQAPRQITSFCRVTKIREGEIELHCAGQSTGTAKALRTELVHLTSVENPSTAVTVTPMSFFGAVNHFSGGWNYQSAFMKGKSDYVTAPMSDHGIETLMGPLLTESITIVCDSYGGTSRRSPLRTPPLPTGPERCLRCNMLPAGSMRRRRPHAWRKCACSTRPCGLSCRGAPMSIIAISTSPTGRTPIGGRTCRA